MFWLKYIQIKYTQSSSLIIMRGVRRSYTGDDTAVHSSSCIFVVVYSFIFKFVKDIQRIHDKKHRVYRDNMTRIR